MEAATTFTPKFSKPFYQAAPHLFDLLTQSEIRVHAVPLGDEQKNEQKDSIFIAKNDGHKFFFIQQKGNNEDTRFDAFKQLLQTQCQQEPILTDADGYVMDGFARWFALVKIGIEPRFEIANVNFENRAAKITWIRSRKLGRHNLTEKQKMQIVCAEITDHPERSNSWTSELLGCSRTTIVKYRKMMELDGKIGKVERIGKDGSKIASYIDSYSVPLTEEETKKKAEESQQRSKQNLMEKVLSKIGVSEFLEKANFNKVTARKAIRDLAKKVGIDLADLVPTPAPVEPSSKVTVKKSKGSMTIKMEESSLACMPDELSVCQMRPGQVINFQKAILLLPMVVDAEVEGAYGKEDLHDTDFDTEAMA